MDLQFRHLFDTLEYTVSAEGFVKTITDKIFKERPEMAAARKHPSVYLFRGSNRPWKDLQRCGFTVTDDGSIEARISGKQIWCTSRKSYAKVYGPVYLVRLNSSHLTWVENVLGLFDEYVYSIDIPPSAILPVDSEKAVAIMKTCNYLKFRQKR